MSSADDDPKVPNFLSGGGITHRLAQSIDWAKTPLGPPATWPNSLKTTVGILLHSRHPMFLWWGPQLIQIYNDAYVPSFGQGKHPAAMGQSGQDCWQEIWPIIWPQIDDVMSRGRASWNEDQLVPIFRNGQIEEVYWTYGYSPVFVESGEVGGTLVVCTETTERVIGERRMRTMRSLAEQTALAMDWPAMLRAAAQVFNEAPGDMPFALIFSADPVAGQVELAEAVGISTALAGQIIDPPLRDRLTAAIMRGEASLQAPIALSVPVPVGPWSEPVTQALVVPIGKAPGVQSGFIVFGLSSRLPLSDAYRAYLGELGSYMGLAQVRIDMLRVRSIAENERKNLLMQAPVGTAVLTGPEHVFQLANQLYCRFVGRREEELIGKTYRQAFPELLETPLPGILDRVYATGEPFVTADALVPLDRHGNGIVEECCFRFNLEAMRDVNGRVYGMMAVAVDVTDEVRSRQAQERAHAERAKLFGELEAASRAKDEFLAMLGHELRNPLSPIVTALQLIKLRDGGRATREHQIIERQVTHLIRLVDDLLDVSKITSGKVMLKKESIDIAEVLAKAVEMASFLLEQRSHQLVITPPREPVIWEGDPVRLAQVIANLLTNAARYTDFGGHIQLIASRQGEELFISVKDNGIGISPELLPHVFDLFVQGKRSSDRSEGGLGLGLTLVKSLVSLHGGTVSAKSEGSGRGSEFIVRLPAPLTASAPIIRQPAANTVADFAAEKRQRVLIVDDNMDAAELLVQALRRLGYEVHSANDPISALTMIDRFRPDIAVLDIGLPVMDGYELAARIREQPSSSACRLIAVTGYGQAHDRARSHAAGFESHLVKPVGLAELAELIANPTKPARPGGS